MPAAIFALHETTFTATGPLSWGNSFRGVPDHSGQAASAGVAEEVLGGFQNGGVQDFERDVAVEPLVASAVHFPHPGGATIS